MIDITCNQLRVSGITTACRVEKNISAAGSEAEITVICAPGDRYLPAINPACGDKVLVECDSEVLFSGTVERLSFSANQLTVTLHCFDAASLLAKNELYAPFHGTPADIANSVCGAVGLSLGSAWNKAGSIFIPASCALSAHQIIRQAYGGRCVIECVDGHINILEPGARLAEADASMLLGAWARHSVDGMVNRAEIIGYLGRKDAAAQNSSDIEAFGTRQKVFSLSGARSTAGEQAKSCLLGMTREAGIKLYGISPIKCGDRIALDAQSFGIDGEWTATSVSHEISGGFAETSVGMVK